MYSQATSETTTPATGQATTRPWTRGIELSADDSNLFTGRTAAVQAIEAWLFQPDADPSALVVTGASGSGKSAVLARVWHDHAVRVATNGRVSGQIDVAVNAHGHTAAEVLDALDAAVDGTAPGRAATRPAELMAAARTRPRPLVALVDAVDEAADPHDLTDALLAPLARLGAAGRVRLLIGARAPMPRRLAESAAIVDLDVDPYHDPAAITEYAASYLRTRAPWSELALSHPEILERVSTAVAWAAGSSFFTAHVLVRGLADRLAPFDPIRPSSVPNGFRGVGDADFWSGLPRTPASAVAWDLRTRLSSSDVDRAEDLLAPLAFAAGVGLPWEGVWARAAAEASGRAYSDSDLAWLRRELGWYVVEVLDTGRLRFRLSHEIVAAHLRSRSDRRAVHAGIGRALIRHTHPGSGLAHDWAGADQYTRQHLSTHAAAGGLLDGLLADPEFLLHADRPRLLTGLIAAESREARAAAAAYQTVALELTEAPAPETVSRLELAAQCLQATTLADALRRSRRPRSWNTRWTAWTKPPEQRILAGGHTGAVLAVAAVRTDDGPLAITGGDDGTVRVWDLAAGRPIGPPLSAHSGPVRTVAATLWHGRPVAVTVGADGMAYRWDLAIGGELRSFATGGTDACAAVSLIAYGDRCLAVAGTDKGDLWCFDLDTEAQLGPPLRVHAGPVRTLAILELPTGPIAITADGDGRLHLWDLLTIQHRDALVQGVAGQVDALAAAVLGGRAVAVTAGQDEPVRVWDLASEHQACEPLTGHSGRVTGVALVDGDPSIVVSCGLDGTVRTWQVPVGGDPAAGEALITGVSAIVAEVETDRVWVASAGGGVGCLDGASGKSLCPPLTGHRGAVTALAAMVANGEPILLSGGVDGRIRRWSQLTGRPLGRPWVAGGGPIRALAADRAGSGGVAAVLAENGTVELWDVAMGEQIGPTNRVREVAASAVSVAEVAGRSWVIAGSTDGTVAIWEAATGRPGGQTTVLGQHAGPVTVVAADSVGSRVFVVSGGLDRVARRWVVDVAGSRARVVRLPARLNGRSDEGSGGDLRLAAPVAAIALRVPPGDAPVVAVGADRVVQMWLVHGPGLRIEVNEPVTAIALGDGVAFIGTSRGVVAIEPASPGATWSAAWGDR